MKASHPPSATSPRIQSYKITYRVSQKKCPHVSNCHNSFKIGTRNKSKVSFEIFRKSSCWWALKFFNLDFWGLRKWGLKLVTLCLKAWPNQHFSGPVSLMHIEKWNTLIYTWVSIPLPQKKIIDDKKCFKHNKEIFIWKTRVFQFQLCQKKTVTEKVWFGHAFRCRVTNFKPHFLSPQKLKLKNFSAHQQEDFLRISKLTLLLFLVPILKELWHFETWGHFFL